MRRALIFIGLAFLLSVAEGSPHLPLVRLSPICVNYTTPCASDNSCVMHYYLVNSEVCTNMKFSETVTPIGQLSLGKIRLENYHYVSEVYYQTAFNISFTNISWTEMKFGIYLNGNNRKNTCRKFERAENSSLKSLSYDCLWSNESYEGKPYIFYYEARSGNRVEAAQLAFTVPYADKIREDTPKEKWELLTYVETIATSLGQTRFILMWQPAPKHFNVNCYQVFVYSNDSGVEEVIHPDEVCNCREKMCRYTTGKWFGSVRFGVQPIFPNDVQGHIAKTQIFHLGENSTRPLLVALLTCCVVLPVILYLLLLLRNYLLQRGTSNMTPVILIVYTPSTTPHLRAVEALVNFLNSNCNVVALMDELEIPNCPSKDPFIWCNEAILSADVVAVVASPYYRHLRSSDALYRTDRLLLRLLRERFSAGGKTKFCVLMPPYASANDVPFEASNLRRLRLPHDLKTLLQLATFRWHLPCFLAPAFPGALPEDFEMGSELTDSFAAADRDLQENRTTYITEVAAIEEANASPSDDSLDAGTSERRPIATPADPIDMFKGKAEEIATARNIFTNASEDLDKLNLLGESQLDPLLTPTGTKVFDSKAIDLDNLNL